MKKSDTSVVMSRKEVSAHLDAAIDKTLAELGVGSDPKAINRVARALFRRGVRELSKSLGKVPMGMLGMVASLTLADALQSMKRHAELDVTAPEPEPVPMVANDGSVN